MWFGSEVEFYTSLSVTYYCAWFYVQIDSSHVFLFVCEFWGTLSWLGFGWDWFVNKGKDLLGSGPLILFVCFETVNMQLFGIGMELYISSSITHLVAFSLCFWPNSSRCVTWSVCLQSSGNTLSLLAVNSAELHMGELHMAKVECWSLTSLNFLMVIE